MGVRGKDKGVKTVIRGDFNARTKSKRGKMGWEEEIEISRRFKDRKLNKKGKMSVDFIKKRSWFILNEWNGGR